jgi:hypothetical protein
MPPQASETGPTVTQAFGQLVGDPHCPLGLHTS